MAVQISAIGHRLSASFFAAQSSIETAFAFLQSAQTPDTASITDAVGSALEKIRMAEALQPFEVTVIAREALRLAENLREFVGALNLPSGAPLRTLYEQFSEEAELLALGADTEIKSSADLIRSDIASGEIVNYPDWRSSIA